MSYGPAGSQHLRSYYIRLLASSRVVVVTEQVRKRKKGDCQSQFIVIHFWTQSRSRYPIGFRLRCFSLHLSWYHHHLRRRRHMVLWHRLHWKIEILRIPHYKEPMSRCHYLSNLTTNQRHKKSPNYGLYPWAQVCLLFMFPFYPLTFLYILMILYTMPARRGQAWGTFLSLFFDSTNVYLQMNTLCERHHVPNHCDD